MKVYYSEGNKLWYIMCPRCKVSHAFGVGHGFNGDINAPTLAGSIGWTGMVDDEQRYCHTVITNGRARFDDGIEEELLNF